MKVNDQDVQHIADLANLELTPAERHRYIKDLNSILDYVEVLKELDTDGVEPFSSVAIADSWLLREDEPTPGLPHDSALMNAPQTDGTFFHVPKVIERRGEEKK